MSEPNNNRYSEAESYRSRRREEDRNSKSRSGGDDHQQDQNQNQNHDDQDDDHELERSRRMARLRALMKEEDEELAALDDSEANGAKGAVKNTKPQEAIIEVKPEELEGLDEEEQMQKLLGFEGFGSTKGEAVEDNQKSAAKRVSQKNKARKYRQYMNRKNGFNRPLENME